MLRFKPIAALMLAVLLAGSMRGVLIGALDIVLTNDDGYNSPGIVALNKALTSKGHRVLLVAPKNQQSGSGAAISLKIGGTLDVEKFSDNGYWVDGRPADASMVGVTMFESLFGKKPDLFVSGTNEGANMGSITAHSGTVGAAIMATHLGVPSIAVSNFYSIITERATRVPEARYNDCAEFVVMVVASIEANMATVKALAAPMLVNINWPGLPKADIKGVKFTQLGNLGDLMLGSSWNASTSEARPFIAPRSLSDESKDPVRNADWVQVLKGYVAVTVMDVNYAASRRSELARREALLAPLLTKRVASTLAVCEDRVNTATTIPPTPATAFKVLNILIVNDDGCGTEKPTSAEVLLQKLTAAGHKAIVVAPYTDQSGTSASFSYRAPWAVTEPRPNVFCVRGLTGENTPVDAANVGISMMKARNGGAAPDLVVSGINPGENVGFLQTISGTIGATTFTVRQAGIPAIAISTSVDLRTGIAPEWVASAGDFLVQLVETLRKSTPAGDGIPQMSPPLWLAVNFPTRTLAAVSNVQVTTQERAFRFELLAKYNATTGDADANIYGLSAGKDPNGDVFVTASGGISISILDGDLGVGKCSNEYGRIKSVLQPALRKYRRRLARSRR